MMVEGRHWRTGADMADVAWKLIAVNLSDLAAKGAVPVGVLLGHTLGDGDEQFLAGLRDVLETYGVPLLGGDTVASGGARTLGCTAIGRAAHTPVPSRSGAQIGDGVYVTGVLGRAMLGFEQPTADDANARAFNRPTPLLKEGQALAPYVTAMMDVSDGLLLDCWRLASASDVTIELASDKIPVADPARRDECVRWGDDYQLLFTASANSTIPVPATRIGDVNSRRSQPLSLDHAPLTSSDKLGYEHRQD